MAVFFTYLFNVFAIALPGMDFAPFKKPRAEVWGFSRIAALYLGPRAALAGGWPRNAPAGAVLAIPMKFCSTTFHGGQDFPSELDGFFYLPIDLKALLHFPLR